MTSTGGPDAFSRRAAGHLRREQSLDGAAPKMGKRVRTDTIPGVWARAGGSVIDAVLEEMRDADELEYRRVLREIDRGGWLRLVVEQPKHLAGLIRLRVRLVSGDGSRNRWVYATTMLPPEALVGEQAQS